MSVLHKKWLTFDTTDPHSSHKYHPKLVWFGLFLKPLRRRAEHPIESTRPIALRIPVQQHIFNRTHLGWFDSSARVLYVDLKEPDNSYGMCKD